MMKDQRGYSEKEQRQITLCQRLISKKSYLCQEEIRRDLQRHGFAGISQSSVSRLLKILGCRTPLGSTISTRSRWRSRSGNGPRRAF